VELHDYLRALRRRWMIIAFCVLLAVAAAAAMIARETPTYRSTIQMFVSTPQTVEGAAYQGGLFSQQRVVSYADLVVGERVGTEVVTALGLDMTSQQLQRKLSSRVVPDTVLFEVTATDASPERAQAIANAVGVAFTDLVAELETSAPDVPPPIKVTTVDLADLATAPASPQPFRTLPLAAILGLLAGLGLALVRETLDVSVKDVERLGERLGAPAVGLVGYDNDARKSPLPVLTRPQSAHAEAFRQLRTNLQFVDIDQGTTKTLVITSSLPSEGKTRTAANLAIAIAQAGQRVVLVEADLRRPRLNTYLGLVDEVGVTTVLLGQVTLDEALQPYGDLPLEVLACGRVPPNPSELLSSDRMQQLLANLRERTDVIIIDAPPLLPVTDAAVLARVADGAVLVVRHGKTTYAQVDRAVENLRLAGARLLGTIVNMTPARGSGAYAYSYSYAYAPSDRHARSSSFHRSTGSEPSQNGAAVADQDADRSDRSLTHLPRN
jgi:capsular exopolysaccharide synthesis family protein